MRLRVVWGLGETMATFWPTWVLTSVDLPALGRFTIATNPDLKGMDQQIVRLWRAARKLGVPVRGVGEEGKRLNTEFTEKRRSKIRERQERGSATEMPDSVA